MGVALVSGLEHGNQGGCVIVHQPMQACAICVNVDPSLSLPNVNQHGTPKENVIGGEEAFSHLHSVFLELFMTLDALQLLRATGNN